MVYILTYFKEQDESLYGAVSDDGFDWRKLNGGQALLRSEVGTRCIRDPYLYEDETGVFHAVWTDGWQSRSIGYARSHNLVEWEDERLLPVMEDVPGTRNCWAPEMFWDASHSAYRILWSSTVAEGEEPRRDHRIWSTLTRDFRMMTKPELFFDPGYNVIDATVIDAGERYFMVFKDERGHNDPTTPYKALRSCYFAKTEKPEFTAPSPLLTPALTEGPTLFPVTADGQDGWLLLFDHFLEHRYGALWSADLKEWTEPSQDVLLPEGIRHVGVIRSKRRFWA